MSMHSLVSQYYLTECFCCPVYNCSCVWLPSAVVLILQLRNSISYFLCNNYISATVPSTINETSLAITVKVTVKGMQQVLFVNWTIPQSDVQISQYHIQYRNETPWTSAFEVSVSSPTVYTILTGLEADTKYSVRVRAVSAVGHGNWSKVQTMRTYSCEWTLGTVAVRHKYIYIYNNPFSYIIQ